MNSKNWSPVVTIEISPKRFLNTLGRHGIVKLRSNLTKLSHFSFALQYFFVDSTYVPTYLPCHVLGHRRHPLLNLKKTYSYNCFSQKNLEKVLRIFRNNSFEIIISANIYLRSLYFKAVYTSNESLNKIQLTDKGNF